MNVKNFANFDKENRVNHLNFTSSSHISDKRDKEKKIKKMGQEIRGRMKISNKTKVQPIRQGGRLQNSIKANLVTKPKFKEEKQARTSRAGLLKKSIEFLEPMTNRSVKSVRFDERCDDSKFSRKHSTSSILKNGNNLANSTLSQKNSMKSSICSNILRQEQSSQNVNGNKGLKDKYQRQLQILKIMNKKYSDELYPPIKSSLCFSSNFPSAEIKWIRISQLFPGTLISVWNSEDKGTIQCSRFGETNSVIPNCLNAIKKSNFLLEKMFESQRFNPNGIYYVKINQNNTWKYMVVDDYIPTIKTKTKYEPLFINVDLSEKKYLQIWPFLLMKAYAKYYSTYESLLMANQIDFLQEITGCPIECVPVNADNLEKIGEKAQGFDVVGIVEDEHRRFHPLKKDECFSFEDSTQFYQAKKPSSEIQFMEKFVNIYFINLHKYFYTGFCTIRQTSSSSPLRSFKGDDNFNASLRYIKLEEASDCAFSVVQKDMKHYRGQYRYTWIRMIVVMKEGDKGYRWIGGTYKKGKIATLTCRLEAGQYFIILMPEWINQIKDFNLVYMGNSLSKLERKNLKDHENILIQSAMDLAQQNGTLNQINKNICSYNYIDNEMGLIIENINNERPMGDIRIYRSIEGLIRSYPIKAFNKQLRNESELQIKIKCLDHFTVVLGTVGGADRSFLQSFNFGT